MAVQGLAATLPAALPVGGIGPAPVEIDIAALPLTSVTWTVHGKTVSCEGPWLADVLVKAGAPAGEAVRGDALTLVVAARGADGYRVAFTLGELDHGLGDAPVIVADRCDGQPLAAADGPLRLAAARDRRGARSVRQLAGLELRR